MSVATEIPTLSAVSIASNERQDPTFNGLAELKLPRLDTSKMAAYYVCDRLGLSPLGEYRKVRDPILEKDSSPSLVSNGYLEFRDREYRAAGRIIIEELPGNLFRLYKQEDQPPTCQQLTERELSPKGSIQQSYAPSASEPISGLVFQLMSKADLDRMEAKVDVEKRFSALADKARRSDSALLVEYQIVSNEIRRERSEVTRLTQGQNVSPERFNEMLSERLGCTELKRKHMLLSSTAAERFPSLVKELSENQPAVLLKYAKENNMEFATPHPLMVGITEGLKKLFRQHTSSAAERIADAFSKKVDPSNTAHITMLLIAGRQS